MAIPTRFDHELAAIDDMHGSVMIRLRTWRRADPARRDPGAIREALRAYVDAVMKAVNDADVR